MERRPGPGAAPRRLIDLVGRADAEQVRATRPAAVGRPLTSAVSRACTSASPRAGEHTHRSRNDPISCRRDRRRRLRWLEARSPGSWQVTVRPEQVESVGARGLRVLRELAVLITDSCPAYTPPDGITLGPARTAAEFLSVFGTDLAPVVTGEFGQPGQEFLVLRDADQIWRARGSALPAAAPPSLVSSCSRTGGARGSGPSCRPRLPPGRYTSTGLVWLHCEAELIGFYERLGYRPLTRHVHLGPACRRHASTQQRGRVPTRRRRRQEIRAVLVEARPMVDSVTGSARQRRLQAGRRYRDDAMAGPERGEVSGDGRATRPADRPGPRDRPRPGRPDRTR